ncbi:MAG TPA: hypothetical protein VLG76_01715 [Rhabdochlamydiaceae bacterium]|nr:hypothetical protein [Rhabdochlamydiaceae bacterium]
MSAINAVQRLNGILDSVVKNDKESLFNNNSIFAKFRNGLLAREAKEIAEQFAGKKIKPLNDSEVEQLQALRENFDSLVKQGWKENQGPFFRDNLFEVPRASNTQKQIENAIAQLEKIAAPNQISDENAARLNTLKEGVRQIRQILNVLRKKDGNNSTIFSKYRNECFARSASQITSKLNLIVEGLLKENSDILKPSQENAERLLDFFVQIPNLNKVFKICRRLPNIEFIEETMKKTSSQAESLIQEARDILSLFNALITALKKQGLPNFASNAKKQLFLCLKQIQKVLAIIKEDMATIEEEMEKEKEADFLAKVQALVKQKAEAALAEELQSPGPSID